MCIDEIVWPDVPSGSTVEISVVNTPGMVTAGADVLDASGHLLEQWHDAELRPGPRAREILAGQRLIIETRVANVGTSAADVTITATLKGPDGGLLAGPLASPDPPPCHLQPGTHHLLTVDVAA